MARFLAVGPLLFVSLLLFAQSPVNGTLKGTTLATKSVVALTGGNAIGDVTLAANATSIAGSDQETGSASLYAKGTGESLIELALGGGRRSELRLSNGGRLPQAKWKKRALTAVAAAQHNAWTDAVWFFPALSSLTQVANPNYLFSYVGKEQRDGVSVEHLRISQKLPSDTKNILRVPQMSAMDFYLDSISLLPLSITFNVHPDKDMNTNIPVEIRFADYRAVNGIQVPYHIQRLLNGGLALDIVVTNAVINSGLSDTQFTLQ